MQREAIKPTRHFADAELALKGFRVLSAIVGREDEGRGTFAGSVGRVGDVPGDRTGRRGEICFRKLADLDDVVEQASCSLCIRGRPPCGATLSSGYNTHQDADAGADHHSTPCRTA